MKWSVRLVSLFFLLAGFAGCSGNTGQTGNRAPELEPFPVVETGDSVIPAPEGVHPFYKKYTNAGGIVIVSSGKVPDAALLAARSTVLFVLSKRPDVHEAMLANHPRISIMARSETASDLPEYGPESDGQWGLGQMPGGPTTLVSERGICYEGNPEYIANFLLHEFVHMMHNLGMPSAEPGIDDAIYRAYLDAVEKGTFIPPQDEPREGITPFEAFGDDEYFTHSVNAWFDLNESLPGPWVDVAIGEWGPPSGTKKELKERDPAIYEIISRFFPDSPGEMMKGCRTQPRER